MNTSRLVWALLLGLSACASAPQAQVKLADRAYTRSAGPECVGAGQAGCEVFPLAMQVTGSTPLVLRAGPDASAPIAGRVRAGETAAKLDNAWLHFFTHGGVVLKAGPGLAAGDKVYPSARFGQDSYPFADWDDPDDEFYEVKVQGSDTDHWGIGVYFNSPGAPVIEWKPLQPEASDEHWVLLQLAGGPEGWAGPCTGDQEYTCAGSRLEYARIEDTPASRLARAEKWLEENPDYESEYYGDDYSGLPPPEYKPGDPRLLRVLRGGNISHASFSPDGLQVVTASRDGTVRIWNTGNGEEVGAFTVPGSGVAAASFSPDGSRIVTANGDGTAGVWAKDGTRLLSLAGHHGGTTSAAYSPDGTRIATTGGDNIARIWDAASGEPVQTLTSLANPINFAAFLPDGARMATGSYDAYETEIWDLATGRLLQTLQTGGLGSGVDVSPDGTRIASIGWDTVTVHDASTGKEMFRFSIDTKHVGLSSLAFSPDGTRIITGDEQGFARVWDAADGSLLFGLNPYDPKSPHWRPGPVRPIEDVAISADGRLVLTSGRGAAHLWGAE